LARYTVVFDACVLYPAPLRDLLVQLATADLFRAKWSDQIHDEWIAALLANRNDLPRTRLNEVVRLMHVAVPDSRVEGHDYLIDSVNVPDPNDRHVVAAAIHSKADAIVTFNLKDFPVAALQAHNLEAIHPDEFITHQIGLDQAKVIMAAQLCCSRLINPPKTGEEYLETLAKQGLPKTVAFLERYVGIFCAFREQNVAPRPSAEIVDLRSRVKPFP